jgi:hypothetical protein
MICDLCKKETEKAVSYNGVNVCPRCDSRKRKSVLQRVAKALAEKVKA